MSEQERCPECHRPGWQRCSFDGCPGWRQAAPTPPASSETWLRERHGAYRGIPHWRELEEAFNAGRASATTPPAEPPEDVRTITSGGSREASMPDMTDIERLARAAGVEASAWKVRNDGWGVNTWHYMAALPNWAKERAPLYSVESVAAIVAQARKEALEEAARVCGEQRIGIDGFGSIDWHVEMTAEHCADAIRALK